MEIRKQASYLVRTQALSGYLKTECEFLWEIFSTTLETFHVLDENLEKESDKIKFFEVQKEILNTALSLMQQNINHKFDLYSSEYVGENGVHLDPKMVLMEPLENE